MARTLGPARRLAFAALTTMLAALLAEGVARIALPSPPPGSALAQTDPEWLVNAREGFRHSFYVPDPYVMWMPRPGYSSAPSGNAVYGKRPLALNAFGQRSPEWPRKKPDGVRRVLVLGGSHPFGMWVETDEVYSSVLQRLLDARAPGGWQVMNASSPGHTTFQGRMYVEHHALQFEPDVVVFDLGMNDELPLSVSWAQPDHVVQGTPPWLKAMAGIADRSAVYRGLRAALSPAAPKPVAAVRVPPDKREENLDAVGGFAAAHGFRVLYMSQVGVEGFAGPGKALCTYRPQRHKPYADICAVFEGLGMDAGRYFVDRIHASPEGHRLIGEAVFERLQALGWLD